jgi:hypothetical protein
MPTRAELSQRRPAQRMRKPLRFRAVCDLSRPTPTRTALKPESSGERRNQRLRQFGRPEKRQSRALRQANRLRRHRNRNRVVALKQLQRDGRSGKSRRPAILECGPSPRFVPTAGVVGGLHAVRLRGRLAALGCILGFRLSEGSRLRLVRSLPLCYTQPFGMGARGHFALRQSSWFLDVEMRINPPQPPLSAASRDTRSGRRAWRRPSFRRRSSSCRAPSREDW